MPLNCDPDALIEAATQYRKITGSNVGAVVIYLLAQKAGLGNLTADQLIDLARCYDSCIPPGMMKAVEIALLCSATGGVTPCPPQLPCPPSGGCTYQDMQVAWTPTNITLADKLGFISQFNDPNDLPGITSLHLKQSSSTDGINIQGCPDLTSFAVDWTSVGGNLVITGCPLLVSFTAASLATSEQQLQIANCPLLASLSFPSLIGQDYSSFTFTGLGLDAASVNGILAMLVAIPTWPNGGVTVDTSGGTSAAPSGQGILDKATLNGRSPGCAITN